MKAAIWIIIGLVLVAGLIAYWFLGGMKDAFSPTYNLVRLVSPHDEKLYIKSKNWGVTGDSQVTVVATDDELEFEIDSTRQIIFHGLEPFLYKASNDTLFLFLRQKHKIPDGFSSPWTIIQMEVDNSTMKGLSRDPKLNRM